MIKLPGMNGSRKKKWLVGFVYFIGITAILGFFLPEPPNEPVKVANEPVKVQPIKKEVVKVEEPKTIAEQVELIAKEEFGESNGPEDNTLKYIKHNEADGHLDMGIYSGGELFMIKDVVLDRLMDSLEQVKGIEGVSSVYVQIYYPTTDKYGDDMYVEIFTIDLSEEALRKINYDNFNTDNLKVVADSYWENPKLNK